MYWVYWPWPRDDLYWFWVQKVNCQRQIWQFNFALFPHDNSFAICHRMMILHTCVDHDPERTSTGINFGFKKSRSNTCRSKVKVKIGISTSHRFCTISPLPFAIQWWYFTHVLTMTQRGSLLILESKGQRARSYLDFELFTVSTQ